MSSQWTSLLWVWFCTVWAEMSSESTEMLFSTKNIPLCSLHALLSCSMLINVCKIMQPISCWTKNIAIHYTLEFKSACCFACHWCFLPVFRGTKLFWCCLICMYLGIISYNWLWPSIYHICLFFFSSIDWLIYLCMCVSMNVSMFVGIYVWCTHIHIYYFFLSINQDLAFKIVNREWELSHRHGFRCQFNNSIFQLWFRFKRYRYRR